jgi:hypothetical protein
MHIMPTTPKSFIRKYFPEWLAVRSQGRTLRKREDELKQGDDGEGGLKDAVMELGYEDENGSYIYDLPKAVEFQDENGNVLVYTALKAQRSLTPASPVPDPEMAEALLRKKGMWLSEVQEEQIRQLQMLAPLVTIHVEVDVDAVSAAYLKGVLTEKEYDSILQEQTERFSFVTLQDK